MPQVNQIFVRAAKEDISASKLILQALNTHDTINAAAASLGVHYSTLMRTMRELRVESTTTYYIPEQSEQGVA